MKMVMTLGSGDERTGFRLFALIIAVIFVLSTLLACFTIKEKSTVDMDTPGIGEMFKGLFRNDQAVAVVIAIVLVNCSLYVTSNLLIYFFKYDMGGDKWYDAYTLFNTFGGAVQILSMMIMYPLFRKFMKSIRIFYVSLIMAISGYGCLLVLMSMDITSVFVLFIPAFFIFTAFGMLTVLTTVFLADTVDYGELKNGRRDESVIFSMQTFVVKLASGVAAMAASVCLAINKLSSSTEVVETAKAASTSVVGLRLTMTIIPIVGLFLALLVFKRKYILTDEKLEEINAKLSRQ
jgi:melibiose permease